MLVCVSGLCEGHQRCLCVDRDVLPMGSMPMPSRWVDACVCRVCVKDIRGACAWA